MNAQDILRMTRLFNNLSAASLRKIGAIANKVRFAKGTTILRPGGETPGIYIVGAGRVRVFKISESGKEHVLHVAHPGMTFGEVAAIGGFPSPAYAQALDETTAALIPSSAFRSMLKTDHELCFQFVVGMSMWVRQLVGLLEDIVLRDALGRVAAHLYRCSQEEGLDFRLPMLKKDLASHLNLTSETLSRTLRRLADAEIIALPSPGHVQIIDIEKLEDIKEGLLPAEFG